MVSNRTLSSLAQYLGLQDGEFIAVLLDKHSMRGNEVLDALRRQGDVSLAVVRSLRSGAEGQVLGLLDEVVRTDGDLRNRVQPRYRYDERYGDLKLCLQLDGYIVADEQLVPVDPTIEGTPPIEDDLVQELKASGLTAAGNVIQKLRDSADSFRRSQPNFNSSLNDARIALQTLATDIAETRNQSHPGNFDRNKWGQVVAYLRKSGLVTHMEEEGLTGVFSFISPGSHQPLGAPDAEMTRLGRSLAASMCYFLVKRYRTSP